MILTITYLELRSPLKFFELANTSLKIMRDLKKTPCVAHKNTGIWTKHYTMTLWKNREDMRAFAQSGAHTQAIKQRSKLAKEIRILTIEADGLMDWKTAKARLAKEGKIYT